MIMKINTCICIAVAVIFCLTQSSDAFTDNTNDTLLQFAIFSDGNNSALQAVYKACEEKHDQINCFKDYFYDKQPFNVSELYPAMDNNEEVCA